MVKLVLIPQFSIRWLLGLTTVCAVIFSIIGAAVRGHYWTAGVSVAIVSLVVVFVVHALFFALVSVFTVGSSSPMRPMSPGESPFAAPPDDREEPATPIILD